MDNPYYNGLKQDIMYRLGRDLPNVVKENAWDIAYGLSHGSNALESNFIWIAGRMMDVYRVGQQKEPQR